MFPLKDNIPTERFPVVTVALIVANVLVYFFWQTGGITLGDPRPPRLPVQPRPTTAAIPYELTHPASSAPR